MARGETIHVPWCWLHKKPAPNTPFHLNLSDTGRKPGQAIRSKASKSAFNPIVEIRPPSSKSQLFI